MNARANFVGRGARMLSIATMGVALVLAAVMTGTASQADGTVDRLAIDHRQVDTARIVYPADRPPILALPGGGGGQTIHSVLNVRRVLSYGDYVWNDAGVGPGPIFIRVDLGRQLLSVFRGGDEIGTALVLYGADGRPTPHGVLTILAKDENHYSRSYDAPMPFMLRLTADGVAIHASDVRKSAATHGCIGVPAAFARRLFEAARVGDTVGIVAPATSA